MNSLRQTFVALALGVGACFGSQAELIGLTPYADSPWGQQSDANTATPYTQSFTATPGFVLESIRWWGYHGVDSLGASADNFVVWLDGVAQTGTLSINVGGNGFDEYILDVADSELVASTLAISNDSFDVEWFWQSAAAVGNPDAAHADAVAFSLVGRIDTGGTRVPEPATWAMVLVGVGLASARRYKVPTHCKT